MPTTPDFNKIWSSNSSLTPYSWSDADYLKGWETVGNTPPSRGQFDAIQKTNDEKAKWLKDTLDPLVATTQEKERQKSTAYAVGDVVQSDRLPPDWLLICTTAGTSDSGAISFPAVLLDGATITDGTVVWTLHRIATYGGLHFRKSLTPYAVGDIVYSMNLPSYLRLECVAAGTTGTTEPDYSSMSQGGGTVVDGTCTFIVDDVRDGTPVGQVRASMFVPAGYVKLEGATVNRSNYPRLVALATKYSLWTADTANNPGLFGEGDGSTTMVLPNWTGRMAQFASTAGGKVDAGVPNIIGNMNSVAQYSSGGFIVSGAFKSNGWSNSNEIASAIKSGYTSGNLYADAIQTNAYYANSIYGSSTTVQPPSINVFAIMRY